MVLFFIVQQEPYTFVTRSGLNPVYSYYGFIPDLIAALSKRLHFSYELYNVSADYGRLNNNKTNEWTGMIGEVIRRDVRITFIFFSLYFQHMDLLLTPTTVAFSGVCL